MTDDEKSFYQENGYLVVRGLFSAEELARWCERSRAIASGHTEAADGMTVMRDVMVVKGVVEPETKADAISKLQDFEGDPILTGYIEHSGLLDRVEEFTGPDIASIHSMLINKPPGLDGRHPLHQDKIYFPFGPVDKIVATWTALEACRRENGCLAVVPGSHRDGELEHENPDWEYLNFGYFGAKDRGPQTPRVHLEMEPGDTVFFHPLLLHGSGRNRSNGFRRAITAHYASAACRYDHPEFPPDRPYTLRRGKADPEGIIAKRWKK